MGSRFVFECNWRLQLACVSGGIITVFNWSVERFYSLDLVS